MTGFKRSRAHGLAFARAAEAWRRDRLAAKLAAAQGWICTWCCQPLPGDLGWTNIDHVIPASQGGPHDRWNLDVLHSRCNIAKRDKITPRALELAAEHGITIAAYLDRADVTESVSADSAAAIVIPGRRRVALTEGPPIAAARAPGAATCWRPSSAGYARPALASVPGRECSQPFVGFAEVEREPLQSADHVPQLGELAR